ncbi:MAG: hypothetical protein MI717_14520 [Spirochaetales bacterium]|nr:hypothetical protein [Spirochaetales bacterium]
MKALSDHILLTRSGSGDMVFLSFPCDTLTPGTLLSYCPQEGRCPITRVGDVDCPCECGRNVTAMVIDAKDVDAPELLTLDRSSRRNVS